MDSLETLTYTPGSIDPLRSLAFEGRLMAPHEVTEAFALRGELVPPELKGQWSLCGSATKAMFEGFRTLAPRQLRLRLSVFTTPSGGAYLVLTHQLGLRQHRFLLPLWDLRVREGVKALSAGKLTFMLAQEDGELAMVFSSSFKPAEVEPVLEYDLPHDPEKLLRLVHEMPLAVQMLRQLQAVPTCGPPGQIEEVALSVLMPVHAVLSIVRGGGQKA